MNPVKISMTGFVERLDVLDIDGEDTLNVDFEGKICLQGPLSGLKGKFVRITIEEQEWRKD